jgi:hypothetical protein
VARFFTDSLQVTWIPEDGPPVDLSPHVFTITPTRRSTMSRQDALRRQLAAIAEELDRLSSRPDEPRAGTVIQFAMQFQLHSTVYDYAAIKAGDGLWYTTGPRSPKGYTWDELLDWMEGNTTGFMVLSPKKQGWRALDG